MSTQRSGHSATVMLDGRVLIVGGNNGSADLASAEIFDPVTGTIAAVASSLTTPRQGHLAFLLPNNNTVLIVGGTSAGAPLASAEVFTPWLGTFAATGSLSTARSFSAGSPMKQDGLLVVAGGQDASAVAVANKDLYGFATVKTDQADYPPGTTVNITGSGWQPGETVTLTLVESPLLDTHGPYTTVADANGSISDSSFITDAHDFGIRFFLTATGTVSQTQTTFTDANDNTTTTVSCLATTLLAGSSTTCTATVKDSGGTNGAPTGVVNWSILPALGNFIPTGCSLVTGASSTSTCTSTFNATSAGSGTITANYLGGGSGTTQWKSSSDTLGITINQESTATTLTSSVNPSVFGQSATLTATVVQTTGSITPNAGIVTFKDGATNLELAL